MRRGLSHQRAKRRREEALRVALGMLRNEGPAVVTLRAVAARAGIPLGTLTYYFAGRDELFREALELWVDEELDRVRLLLQAIRAEGLSPREAAVRCAEILESYDPEQIAQYELYLTAARSPRLRATVEAAFAAYDGIVAEILRAAGAPDAERLAPLFVSLVDGLSMRRLAAPAASPELADALTAFFEATAATGGPSGRPAT